MERYGYIRVSSKDQNPDRQMLAMRKQKIQENHIYLDKMSGKDFSIPQYLKLLKGLKKGDDFIIKSIYQAASGGRHRRSKAVGRAVRV